MSMILNAARFLSLATTGIYGLSLIVFLLLHFLIGERWVFVAFLNSFAHLFLIPALILLPICLLAREWLFAALLTPAVIFFAVTWGQFLLPKNTVHAQDNERSLRVLSYNVSALGQDPQLLIELLRSSDADIVALQELGRPYASVIESQLQDLYPYMALHPQEYTTMGQGIISRFPLTQDSYWQYDFLPNKLGHQRVFVEEFSLTIYNMHPTHPGMQGEFFNPTYRPREIADILERSSAEDSRVILLGDFNMPDLSDDYRAIRESYGDAFADAGQGLGWTFSLSPYPAFLRLDYLFYSAGIRPISAEVLSDSWGSDHHPLLVNLSIVP